MAFDLGEFKKSTSASEEIKIVHPATGEDLGVTITVMSPDSDEYRKIALKQQNENMQYFRKHRGKTTAEKMEADALELLVAATVGWTGIEENGAPLPFSQENVRRVYRELPFIREQVDEFVGDRRNFIKN